MTKLILQDVLIDKSATGKERPWSDKKMANELLALAYENIDPKKAARLKECASWLEFALVDGGKKLTLANFCRVRLCPMCSWRRGLKIFKNTSRVVASATTEYGYQYIFLTLTAKNCSGEQLKNEIDKYYAAWNRMAGYKDFRSAIKGWYRGLEVKHNVNHLSDNYNTYHPHFHCVLAVNPSYFTDKTYISHAKWTSLWQSAMNLDYEPQVDIRKVKGSFDKTVAEIAKYAVKDGDYIIPDDWDLTTDTVRLLDKVLDRRRLVAYGGKFRELHKKLNLDDEMDGDLINTGDDQQAALDDAPKIYYAWNVGYSQYTKEPG